MNPGTHHVALYVTCLVDIVRPSVGFASVKLLEAAGFRVSVPADQTCCGQPAFNSGDVKTARALGLNIIKSFEHFDSIVVPSASCAAMLKIHLPPLFTDKSTKQRAIQFADRVFELTEFLHRHGGMGANAPTYNGCIAFHDGCSGKRELALGDGPRALLGEINGVKLVDLDDAETCCGFGGTFSVRFPEISNAMVSKKVDAIKNAAPDLITGCELGCLMHIAGKLNRERATVSCRHIAEVLAGSFATPSIGPPAHGGDGDPTTDSQP